MIMRAVMNFFLSLLLVYNFSCEFAYLQIAVLVVLECSNCAFRGETRALIGEEGMYIHISPDPYVVSNKIIVFNKLLGLLRLGLGLGFGSGFILYA